MDEIQFDDFTIREIFGTDTAEDEDPERLKAYFFRNRSYQNLKSQLPLRILVGHKGIGKSALLRMSYLEDTENGELSLWLQPNDLVIRSTTKQSMLEKIESYKDVINRLIYQKSLDHFEIVASDRDRLGLQTSAKRVINALAEKVADAAGLDVGAEQQRLRKAFQSTRIVRVYIDDIDRGWSASPDDIQNISALVNASRDLTNESGSTLQIRIGLRSDAYYLYRTSDESTDKIESNVIRLSWSRHDVLVVAALRVARYFGKRIDLESFEKQSQKEIARELYPVIEERFTVGRGHWAGAPTSVVLMSLNRNRPRDLVKLLTEAAKEAYKNGHGRISATDLENVFSNYSHGRITDLCLEFKSELPEIEKLLYNMAPTTKQMRDKEKRWRYTNDELIKKLRNIMSSHTFHFRGGFSTTPKKLAEFLYKIDFLIARNENENGQVEWTHFDQNRMLQSQFVDFGYKWEVHPAYRWALQPKGVLEVLESIDAMN